MPGTGAMFAIILGFANTGASTAQLSAGALGAMLLFLVWRMAKVVGTQTRLLLTEAIVAAGCGARWWR